MIRLRELREEKGVLQKDVAAYVCRSPITVGDWERGRSQPSIEDLIKLADYFGRTVDYLIGRTDEFEATANGGFPTKDVVELLCLYRSLSEKQKEAVLTMIKAFCGEA